MAEQAQGFGGVTRDGGVAHAERGDLGAAAVVEVHGFLGDFAGDIGEQLLAGGGQFGGVRCGGGQQGQRSPGDGAAGGRELAGQELALLAIGFESLAVDEGELRAHQVDELLAAVTARVVQNQHDVRLGSLQVGQGVSEEVLAHGGNVLHLNDFGRTEERGGRLQGQLPRRVGRGVHLHSVYLGVCLAEELAQTCRGAGGKVLLGAVEHDGRCGRDGTPGGVEGRAAAATVSSSATLGCTLTCHAHHSPSVGFVSRGSAEYPS